MDMVTGSLLERFRKRREELVARYGARLLSMDLTGPYRWGTAREVRERDRLRVEQAVLRDRAQDGSKRQSGGTSGILGG